MAVFDMQVPKELISQFEALRKSSDKIFEDMTRAGADVVLKNIKSNVPESFKNSEIMRCLKVTKTYKTPTDGGINTKVGFYGYFNNKNGERVPAELVCNVMEYGRSSSPYPKQPFLRKSFKKKEIRKAMRDEMVKDLMATGMTQAEASSCADEALLDIKQRHGG